MTHSNEALSLLRGITLEDLTTEQMSSVLGPSSISPAVVSQFEQAALLAAAQSAQKTYPWGLPIPAESAIAQYSFEADGYVDIQPPGTELWEIAAMEGYGALASSDLAFFYWDGTAGVEWHLATVSQTGTKIDMNSLTPTQIRINNSLYFRIQNTNTVAGTLMVAYHKRSL